MKFKIIAFLTILLFSMGTISSALSLEFESQTIHKDEFDILEVYANDLNGDGNYEILAYTAGKKFLCLDNTGNIKWTLESNNSFSTFKIFDIYDSPKNEIILGTENRVVSKNEVYNALLYFIDSEGEEIAIIPILGSILDFDIGDVDSNGTYETIIGADDGSVYLFDEELNLLWNYKTRGYNFRTLIVDLNEDGINEIMVVSWDNTYMLDGFGKLTKSYETKHILRDLYLDRYNNMIHVSRWFREDSQTWKGTVVYSLNRNLGQMWEFRTETESSASTFFDVNNDGREETIIAGTKGEIIVLDSRGAFLKRFDLPDRIFKIEVMKEGDNTYLVAGCKDNNLYIIDYDTGNTEYKFQTQGWVETFFILDINKDGKQDILVGSNDNKLYLLLQEKEVIKPHEDNKSIVDKPPEQEQPKTETKNVPFEEVGILGGTVLGAIYIAIRKRK
ncbi:MAG: FG-GAP repeat protein [Candidatus Methanofastidiosum methylothiophilum]|uniref:FG-GAP repeat protein n=1 Tax=Candidatus Methanofastidiosum methylothiophilum TaxID=1705564 RepID=A0A150IMN1_9EURY|nr:MAG: FG-GAP repeat protein [Candidatus Methanofastidiosum methylthiophilus]KYC48417.1 MAG: FG-GAP repeat protein [Candidatus Methanofastidiosum methylthiophilus]KYC51071.1 MAG: FG-GAP repeat protein [Candidatus Methanofastidiosum methylthiophilus]